MNNEALPRLRKAGCLRGRSLVLRDAHPADAEFIVGLRTDARKSRHLSATSPDVQRQRDWLAAYAARDNEAYFIIEDLEAHRLGTVRLYDPRGSSFCWGSWVMSDEAPASAALESALMVYCYALDHLGFGASHFTVHKANESVWQFHERFGAVRRDEDEVQYFYDIDREAILASMQRYRRYLPKGLSGLETVK